MKKKSVALLMACVMLFGVAMGGTLAWLTDKTDAVTNTFTDSDINITLTESDTDPNTDGIQHNYKMVPGDTIAKDPKVTVEAGSEACWLFVKVEENEKVDTFLSYTISGDWTAMSGHDGYYYYNGDKLESLLENNVEIGILTNDQVTVKTSVTKDDMDGIDEAGETKPTLSFTAAAVQKAHIGTVEKAWDELPAEFKPAP